MMCMQLMQQYVQKSSIRSLPLKDSNVGRSAALSHCASDGNSGADAPPGYFKATLSPPRRAAAPALASRF